MCMITPTPKRRCTYKSRDINIQKEEKRKKPGSETEIMNHSVFVNKTHVQVTVLDFHGKLQFPYQDFDNDKSGCLYRQQLQIYVHL